jgi:hypothetical protein
MKAARRGSSTRRLTGARTQDGLVFAQSIPTGEKLRHVEFSGSHLKTRPGLDIPCTPDATLNPPAVVIDPISTSIGDPTPAPAEQFAAPLPSVAVLPDSTAEQTADIFPDFEWPNDADSENYEYYPDEDSRFFSY